MSSFFILVSLFFSTVIFADDIDLWREKITKAYEEMERNKSHIDIDGMINGVKTPSSAQAALSYIESVEKTFLLSGDYFLGSSIPVELEEPYQLKVFKLFLKANGPVHPQTRSERFYLNRPSRMSFFMHVRNDLQAQFYQDYVNGKLGRNSLFYENKFWELVSKKVLIKKDYQYLVLALSGDAQLGSTEVGSKLFEENGFSEMLSTGQEKITKRVKKHLSISIDDGTKIDSLASKVQLPSQAKALLMIPSFLLEDEEILRQVLEIDHFDKAQTFVRLAQQNQLKMGNKEYALTLLNEAKAPSCHSQAMLFTE